MDGKNERGRTPQKELEILRMSLLRVAQALQVEDKLPGTEIDLGDRASYGCQEESKACAQDFGWNRLAGECVELARDLALDAEELWARAKRYFTLMRAYEDAGPYLTRLKGQLAHAQGALECLEEKVAATTGQLDALFDSPEGQAIKKLVGG